MTEQPIQGKYVNYSEQDAARELAAKRAHAGRMLSHLQEQVVPATTFKDPDALPVQVTFSPTWDEFHRDVRALATRLQDVPVSVVLAVLRGGAVPAAILAHELGVPDVRVCRLASYEANKQQRLQVVEPPDATLVTDRGAGVLVVDDLADTGATMGHLRHMLPEAVCCAPYAKPAGEHALHLWSRQVRQDTWIRFPWEAE